LVGLRKAKTFLRLRPYIPEVIFKGNLGKPYIPEVIFKENLGKPYIPDVIFKGNLGNEKAFILKIIILQSGLFGVFVLFSLTHCCKRIDELLIQPFYYFYYHSS